MVRERAAAALGLAEGQEVDPHVHEMVFTQVDPRTGEDRPDARRSSPPASSSWSACCEAEPHATEARKHELERQAAQQHRESHPYTDFTVSFNKSRHGGARVHQGKRPPGRAGRGPGGGGLLGAAGHPVLRDPAGSRR